MSVKQEESPKAHVEHVYKKCPRCDTYIDYSRDYCNCHEPMPRNAPAALFTEDNPNRDILAAPMNVESDTVNCIDCGLGCNLCHSFFFLKTNSRGWGGKGCRHKQDSIKCTCCQLLISDFSSRNTRKDGKIDFRIDYQGVLQKVQDIVKMRNGIVA
ncbi:MAG: hypothetical protein LBK62_06045 [Treponema sp.]|jgi:hypothetical protein|nr:hypothetical protein [Treponema sp.]